ncbi:MAG: CBS domain-containing protein, partial [Planctomycetaceae bacterium]
IIEQFRETKYRRFPVVKDGRLIGQISRRDVLRAALGCLEAPARTDSESPQGNRHTIDLPPADYPMLVQDVYSAAAATIEEDFDLLRIVRLFRDTSARRLPVIQENRIVGQVSRRDLLQTAIRIFPDNSEIKTPLLRHLRASRKSYPLPD